MSFTRLNRDRFRFLNALAASGRISQIDLPCGILGLNLYQVARHRGRQFPLLCGHALPCFKVTRHEHAEHEALRLPAREEFVQWSTGFALPPCSAEQQWPSN